ncbi:MAG: AAA family ATPase [Gaiella sp.]
MTLPAWLREVEISLIVAPHVVLAGNVDDAYLIGDEIVRGVPAALWRALKPAQYEAELVYDHNLGDVYAVNETAGSMGEVGDAERALAKGIIDAAGEADGREGTLDRLVDLVQRRTARHQPRRRLALVIQQADRLSSPDRPHEIFAIAERFAATTPAFSLDGGPRTFYNVCFWVTRSEHDLPHWFGPANPRIRLIHIPTPGPADRRDFISRSSRVDQGPSEPGRTSRSLELAVDSTFDFQLRSIVEVQQMAQRAGKSLEGIPDAARTLRLGVSDSPWDQEDTRRRVGEATASLGERILGQDAAIRKSVDILMRSVTGMSDAHRSMTSQRPRGVLFFAGPTGVGKTELAKGLTEVIFGSDDRYLRFDMSEYSAEHAEARLVGSPPGYVGHSAGGQLTNAIRQQPFSLILFDEIEKAHPLILDKFLQILDDGRLTDGTGATVYFHEAIIVFTSNAGLSREEPNGERVWLVDPKTPREELEDRVKNGIANFFRDKLNRPELLNRIGLGNVVVFQFIATEIAEGIFDLAVKRIQDRVLNEHGATLTLGAEARASLLGHATSDLSMGGRDVGSRLVESLVNPLARHLFQHPQTSGATIEIERAEANDGTWELTLR